MKKYIKIVMLVMLIIVMKINVFATVPTVNVIEIPSGNVDSLRAVVEVSGYDMFTFVYIVYGVVLKDGAGVTLQAAFQDVNSDPWSNQAPQTAQYTPVSYTSPTLSYNTTYNIEVYVRNSASTTFSFVTSSNFKTAQAQNTVYVGGDDQTQLILSELSIPLSVRIFDGYGVTASVGTTVNFELVSKPAGTAGAYFIDNYRSSVNIAVSGNGMASVRFKLGSKSGEYVIVAKSQDEDNLVTFNVNGYAGSAYFISKYSGDNQSGVVMQELAQPCVVLITDEYGNPVGNVVADTVFIGPTINNGAHTTEFSYASDAEGKIRFGVIPGMYSGAYEMQVSSNGLEGSGVSFSISAIADGITTINWVSGNYQTNSVTMQTLPNSLIVKVMDRWGNAISGVDIGYTMTVQPSLTYPGLITPNVLVRTDSNGMASTYFKTGAVPGRYVLRAKPSISGRYVDAEYIVTMAYTIGAPVITFPSAGYLTSNASVVIRGTSLINAGKVVLNGRELLLSRDQDNNINNWETIVNLSEGNNSFVFYSYDIYGNAGSSASINVMRDSTKPGVPVVIADDDEISGGGSYIIGENDVVIRGSAEIGARVEIYEGDIITGNFRVNSFKVPQLLASAVVTSSAGYSFTLQTDVFAAGENQINVVVIDTAKNYTVKGLIFVKSVDKPTIQNVKINGMSAIDGDRIARQINLEADIFATNIIKEVGLRLVKKSDSSEQSIDLSGYYSTINHHVLFTTTQNFDSGELYDVIITALDYIGNQNIYVISNVIVESYGEGLGLVGKVLAYPNPFEPRDGVNIQYSLSEAGAVTLAIYNKEMRILRSLTFAAGMVGALGGRNIVRWDGMDEWGNRVPYGGYIGVLFGDKKKILGKIKIVAY